MELEANPQHYYPLLVEILQCLGSNYFDRQGTEKGRGGEITLSQKMNGVMERIATVNTITTALLESNIVDGKAMAN